MRRLVSGAKVEQLIVAAVTADQLHSDRQAHARARRAAPAWAASTPIKSDLVVARFDGVGEASLQL